MEREGDAWPLLPQVDYVANVQTPCGAVSNWT